MLEIKKSVEIQIMIEEILDKPLQQWTSEDEFLVSKKWISVDSLKDFFEETIKKKKEKFEEETFFKFEDFDYVEFLCAIDNRDDVWYIGQLYAEIKLLQKLLDLLEKEKLNELVEEKT